jgi:hypothetical protein
MSTSDRLPREVENAIRDLRDNDALVAEVLSLLNAYGEIRGQEAGVLSVKAERDVYDRVLTTLASHMQAVHAIPEGYGIGYQGRFLAELRQMREHWQAHRDRLEQAVGRRSREESVFWLAERLNGVFNTWRVPPKALSGFLKATLPIISPELCPSPRTIDSAVSDCRK